MIARGFTYVLNLLQCFIGCSTYLRSSACITNSILQKLQSDPLIDRLTPDSSS